MAKRTRRSNTQKGFIMFVPVMITPDMLNNMQAGVTTSVQTAEPIVAPARPRLVPATTSHDRAITRRAVTPEMVTEPTVEKRGRGRVAGIYVAKPTPPARLTDSIKRVYEYVRAHKRGTSAKDIQARLGMPVGTVGWALGQLLKQGSVEHVPVVA